MSHILGIDPGLEGALAHLDTEHPQQSQVWDMPVNDDGVDAVALAALVKRIVGCYSTIQAVVEDVHGRPRQKGVFGFGLGTGIIHGCLASAGIPFTLVAPNLWKPAMGLRRGIEEAKADNKSRSREMAANLFPALADKFKRVRDDGRAEALLIAVHHFSLTKKALKN